MTIVRLSGSGGLDGHPIHALHLLMMRSKLAPAPAAQTLLGEDKLFVGDRDGTKVRQPQGDQWHGRDGCDAQYLVSRSELKVDCL